MAAPTQHPQTAESSTAVETAASAPAGDAAEQHLRSLHKMSTTAGLGSTDYVAVNTPAVIALLLGLASAAVLLDPIFFIVPIAGLICSVIAVNQIRKSNGTQTGFALALLALALTFGFSAFVGYRKVSETMENRRQAAAIEATFNRFQTDLAAGNWQGAYDMMGPRFQQHVKPEEFAKFFTTLEGHPYYGRLKDIDWNHQLAVENDPTTHERWARALTRLNYSKAGEGVSRTQFVLHEVDGQWKIEQISGYFGAEAYN